MFILWTTSFKMWSFKGQILKWCLMLFMLLLCYIIILTSSQLFQLTFTSGYSSKFLWFVSLMRCVNKTPVACGLMIPLLLTVNVYFHILFQLFKTPRAQQLYLISRLKLKETIQQVWYKRNWTVSSKIICVVVQKRIIHSFIHVLLILSHIHIHTFCTLLFLLNHVEYLMQRLHEYSCFCCHRMWGDLLLKCSLNFAGANQTEIVKQISHTDSSLLCNRPLLLSFFYSCVGSVLNFNLNQFKKEQ